MSCEGKGEEDGIEKKWEVLKNMYSASTQNASGNSQLTLSTKMNHAA
jgi:hypothetical protein